MLTWSSSAGINCLCAGVLIHLHSALVAGPVKWWVYSCHQAVRPSMAMYIAMAPPRSYPVAIPYPPCLKAISATRPPAMSGVIMPSPLMPTRSAKLESSSFLVADSPVMLSPSDPDASSPSLYATFKILQLVRSVAKRVNRRARIAPPLTKRRPVRARQDSCQDFELEAYEKIDRYLGRCGNKRAKPLTKTVVTDRPEPLPSEGIQW